MKYIPHLNYIREKNCNLRLSEKKFLYLNQITTKKPR